MTSPSQVTQVLGRFPGITAILAIVACYGTLALVSVLAVFGVTLSIHEGAWAGVITGFAWLTAVSILLNVWRYRAFGPLLAAACGAVLVTWVMFVTFSRAGELLGFACLLTAAIWDRRLKQTRMLT